MPFDASKIDAVINSIISRKGNGNGKLIFCNFQGEIDTIYTRLFNNGITRICIIDGRTTQFERAKNIKNNILFEVIILQIQTGCEGLNLQEHFSEVYFVSPNWNPFVEKQAVARVHRIGQKKEVSVFMFQMNDFVKQNQIESIHNEDQDEDEDLEDDEDIIIPSLDSYISQVKINKIKMVEEILPTI